MAFLVDQHNAALLTTWRGFCRGISAQIQMILEAGIRGSMDKVGVKRSWSRAGVMRMSLSSIRLGLSSRIRSTGRMGCWWLSVVERSHS